MDNYYDYLLKIVIIGNTSVGKSSIIRRFCDDDYINHHISTIGVDFRVKTIDIDNYLYAKLQIWDTSGQERFKTITSSYYRGSHGVIVVYDISDLQSFKDVKKWIKELINFTSPNIVLILVANKCDLKNKRVVSFESGKELADSYGILFIEVSSMSNININDIFYKLAKAVVNIYQFKPINSIRLDKKAKQLNPKPCCQI